MSDDAMNKATTDVYLNGEYLPLAEAKISVMDRGFLFGDGVYEVIPAYAGLLFRLEQHMARLDRSLDAILMQNPLSHGEWQAVLNRLLPTDTGSDFSVYLQITRGEAQKRDHSFPPDLKPTVFAMAFPTPQPDADLIARGATAITLPDIRWHLCHIKAITLLGNVLLRQQAVTVGASEAILVRDGYAYEGAATNLFSVKDGVITTPADSSLLLPGVTRDLVVELAQAHDIPLRLAPIAENELADADEIWLTSSTKEVLPVTHLDKKPVGEGVPGPLWLRIRDLFRDYKQRLRAGQVV
jgi:D-alanine transaminase